MVFFLCKSCVNILRRLVSQRLMGPFGVVKLNIPLDGLMGLFDRFISLEVNFFILDGPPKAFNVNVIKAPPFTRHADLDAVFCQLAGPRHAGKLTSLIRINRPGEIKPSQGRAGNFVFPNKD